MLVPDKNDLIEGMTRQQHFAVTQLIRELDRATWTYNLTHEVEVHRLEAEDQAEKIRAIVQDFADVQRQYFLRTYMPRSMSLQTLLVFLQKIGLAAPTQ